jgi:UDP-4-amino-4,6-dideoxy-N-acetyl-beta-L-altrosamine N-acetyltransferase
MTAGTIRPLEPEDLATILAWRNDPATRAAMFTRHAITPQEHGAWFACAPRDRHLLLYEEGGVPRGFAHLTGARVAEWGFYAAPGAPKGTGTRLGRAALAHAFGPLGLHKVTGEVIEGNAPSLTLHRKMGFTHEGTRRAQHWDGAAWRDVALFGLIKDDFCA